MKRFACIALAAALLPLSAPLSAAAQDGPSATGGVDVRDFALEGVEAVMAGYGCETELRISGAGEACRTFRAQVAAYEAKRARAMAACRADKSRREATPMDGAVLAGDPACDFMARNPDLEDRIASLNRLPGFRQR